MAQAAVASLDLTLAEGSNPTTGLYYFDLPRVEAEMVSASAALIYFPRIARAADVAKYLADNNLTLIRWMREGIDDTAGRVALVRLPVTNVVPRLVDPAQGIFEASLAPGLDRGRVLAWASGAGFSLLSYDPATGRARVRPMVRSVAPLLVRPTTPAVRRTNPPPSPVGTTPLFVRLTPSVSDAAGVGARVSVTLTSIGSDGLLVGSVPSSRAAGILQLLSDLPEVQCVADTQTACGMVATPATPPPDAVVSPVTGALYSAPRSLTVIAAVDGAHLSWAAASGASSYLIRRTVSGSTTVIARIVAGRSQFTFLDGTEPADSASYGVAALHGCTASKADPGCDALNPVIDDHYATPPVTVMSVMPAAATPPSAAPATLPAPAGLSSVAADGHVQVSWLAVAGAASYRVYRGATTLIYDATTTDTALIDVGGAAGQISSYAIAAVAGDGREGVLSAASSTAWLPATSKPIIERSLPAAADHLSGPVRLQVEVKSGDGAGSVHWHLTGPRAVVDLGSADGATSKFDRLAWSAARNWDSRSVPDGTYTLRAVATDGASNQNEISQTFRVQNGAPTSPTQIAVATQGSAVTLSWQQVPTADAAIYRIYRDSTGLSAPIAEVPIDQRAFEDRSVAVGPHHYQLVVVDRTGQASQVATADAVVSPAPQATIGRPVLTMRALLPSGELLAPDGRVTDRLLLLSSQLPANADNVRFEFSGNGQSWTSLSGAGCAGSCSLDWSLAGLSPGPYFVRVAATVNGSGISSDHRSFILQTPVPLPAPLSPAAFITPEGISLSWSLPNGVFPTAFAVLRQETGRWKILGAVSGRTSYLDEDAPVGSPVSYRIQPVDRDGTPGTPSIEANVLAAAVSDARGRAAPVLSAPSGVRVLVSAGRVALAWSGVTGADGYLIRRSMGEDGPAQVIARTAGITMFVDRAGPIGGQASYRISALSGSAEGPASDAVSAILIPTPATSAVPVGAPQVSIPGTPVPTVPSKVASTIANGSVQVTWSAAATPVTPTSFNVYRLDPAVGTFVLAESGLSAPSFTDTGLKPGSTIGYAVTATGADGRESGFSSPIWLTAPAAASGQMSLTLAAVPAQPLVADNAADLIARAGAGLSGVSFAFGPVGGPWTQIPGAIPLDLPADPASLVGAGATDWGVSWSSSALPAGQYEIRLTATDASGELVEQRHPILIGGAGARAPPTQGLDLKVTPRANGVHLEWVSTDGEPHQVLRSIFGTAGPFEPIGQVTTGSFEDRNLIPGFNYQYKVIQLSGTPHAGATAGTARSGLDDHGATHSTDGHLTISLPPASISGLALTVNPAAAVSPLPAGYSLVGSAYQVEATSLATAGAVHRLDELATIAFSLAAGTTQALATSMRVLHWDDVTASWIIEGGAADAGLTKVTISTPHFSVFALTSITAQSSAGATPQPPVPPTASSGDSGTNTGRPVNPLQLPKLDIAPDGEVLSLRDERSTTYRNADGTFRKVMSAGPVHYQDSTGQWQNIDTTLITDSGGGFRNAGGPVRVQLPANLGTGPISLSRGPVSVQMALEMAKGGALSTGQDHGRYAGVLNGIDAEYAILPEGIKENLILLARPTSSVSISFRLDTGSLVLQRQPNGAIRGSLGGFDVLIPAPFMVEQLGPGLPGTNSTAIAVSLTGANGHYRITYTPDLAWLSDPSRKYPVVLDPSITFQHGVVNDGLDVMVSSWYPATNYYGGTTYEDVGYDPSVGMTRTYLNFWPTMCDGCWATSATLSMYQYTNYNTQRHNAMRTFYARPAGAWQANTINWSNQPFGSAPVVGAQTLASPGWMQWNVTSIIQAWHNHSVAVNGFVVNDSTETTAYNTSELFYSFIYSSAGYRPQLTITYDTYQYYLLSATLSSPGGWVPSGGTTTANVVLQNLGTATWNSNVRLTYQWLQNGTALAPGFSARVYLPYSLATNQIVQLSFPVSGPTASSGNLQLQFALVNETIFWFQQLSCKRDTPPCPTSYAEVTNINNGASVPIAPESYTMTGVNLPTTLQVEAGSLVTIPVTIKNTDATTLLNTTWQAFNYNDLTRIGIRSYRRLDGSPAGTMSVRTSLPQDLGPGQSASVNTVFQAPGEPGDYVFRLDTVHEHLTPSPGPKDGTLPAGTTWGDTSPLTNTPGTSLAFGSPSYVRTTNLLPSQTGWSIEGWIKPSTTPQDSIAVYNGDNGSGGYGFGVGNGSGGGNGLVLQGLFGGVTWVNSGYTLPAADRWYHVVMTNDGATTRFYVNGAQVFTGTPSAPKPVVGYGSVGALLTNASAGWYFSGYASDVAVYAGAMSASRAMAHYRAAGAPTTPNAYQSAVLADSPVTYYRLNEGGASVARDTSGPTWGEDRGNQPLEVRVRVLAPGENKSAHAPIPLDDGSSLSVNTSNGFATLDASDLSIPERGRASLHTERTYNGVNGALAANGTLATSSTYGIGWTYDFQRSLHLGPLGPQTRGVQTGTYTDSQGRSYLLTWNPARGLFEDAAGNRTIAASTATVVTPNTPGGLPVPGVTPIDQVGNPIVVTSPPAGSPRGVALALGSNPTALIFPQGMVPAQQSGTIEFWLYPIFNMASSATPKQMFLTDTTGQFGLAWNDGTGTGATQAFDFFTYDADVSAFDRLYSPAVTTNAWHHVAITWQENGPKQIYIDQLASPPSNSATVGQSPIGEVFFGYNPAWTTGTTATNAFALNADVAEVRIEGTAITAQQASADGAPGAQAPIDGNTLYLGAFTAPSGLGSIAGTYTLTNADQSQEIYTPWGQLKQERDRQGNAIDYSWDTQGRISQIIDHALPTRSITFSYAAPPTGSNCQSTGSVFAVDPGGRCITYVVNAFGDLTSVTRSNQVPDPLTGVISSRPATSQYAYTPVHFLQQITDPMNGVTTLNPEIAYRRSVMANSPVAYYLLDEQSGTLAADSSGIGHAGTVVGGVTGVAGGMGTVSGTAMQFNGTNAYIRATGWPPAQTSWTLEAWINPAAAQLSLAVYNGDNGGGYGFGLGNGSGASGSVLQGLFGSVVWINSGYTFPFMNRWYDVAMTNDGTTTRFYVNGVQTSGTSSAVPRALTPYPYASIGANLSGGSPNAYFNGAISNVAVYGGALSSLRVQAHYAAASQLASAPGAYRQSVLADRPVAYYPLDEPAGSTTVHDLSVQPGSASGSITSGVAGAFSGETAMQFDGATGGVTLPAAVAAPFQYHDFTVEGWAYFIDSNTADRGIFGAGATVTDQGLHIVRRSNTAYMGFYGDDIGGATVLTPNRWWHLAFTWSATTKLQAIYVNSVLDAQRTSTGALNVPSGSTPFIGRMPWSTFMAGSLDEVAIYPTALTQAQIQAHVTASSITGYRQAVLTNAPIAYYTLDDSTVQSATNTLTGSAAALTGGVTAGAVGAVAGGTAMQFDGTTGYFKSNTNWGGSASGWTAEAWIKPSASQNALAVYNGDDVGGGYGFGIGNGAGGSGLVLTGLFGSVAWLNSGYTMSANTWYHVAMTNDGVTTRFYVNGAQTSTTYSAAQPHAPSGMATIGTQINSSGLNRDFAGAIDEVAIYTGALALSRILAHYNARASVSTYRTAAQQDSLVAYYPLDEGVAPVASLGTSNTAPMFGGVTPAVVGPLTTTSDSALQFDGTTGEVDTGYVQSAVTAYSVEAWIQTTDAGTNRAIVEDRGGVYNSGPGKSLTLGLNCYCNSGWAGAGTPFFAVESDGVEWGVWSTTSISDGKWHHLVGTWSAPSGTAVALSQFSLYIDGASAGGLRTISAGTAPTSPLTGLGPVKIAGHDAWATHLSGTVEDAAIYTSVLSATQVQAHFNARSSSASYQQAVLSDTPAAFYPLNESGLGIAHDISAVGAGATIIGGVSLRAPPLVPSAGSAMTFDGTSGYLSVPTITALQGDNARTVELWLRTTSTIQQVVFDSGSTNVVSQAFAIALTQTNGVGGSPPVNTPGIYVTFWGDDVYIPNTNLADGLTHYLAVTLSGSSLSVYVDGASPGGYVWTGSWVWQNQPFALFAAPNVAANPVWIGHGRQAIYGNGSSYFSGTLDEIAIYNSALTAAQIEGHYYAARGMTPPLNDRPVAYYRLNERNGATAADSSGNGLTGTINGGVGFGIAGALPNSSSTAMSFDGGSGYIAVADNPALATNAASVDAWVKVNTWVATAAIYNRRTAANVGGISLQLDNSPTPTTINFYVYVGAAWYVITAPFTTLGVWHNVVGTYDGATLRIYVDGVQSNSAPVTGAIANPPSPLVQIGRNAANAALFNGAIDELAVFGTALSASQVQGQYMAMLGMTPDRIGSAKDAVGNVTSWVYNDAAATTQVTNALGQTTYYTFQQYGGRTLSVTDTGNNVTTYTWDSSAAYRLTGVVSPTGIRQSQVLNGTAPVGQQDQVLIQDTAAQPVDNKFDFVNGSLPATGQPFASSEPSIWDSSVEFQPGKLTHVSSPALGTHQHGFQNAAPLAIPTGASATQWVYLEPGQAPPTELMIQFESSDISWEHRAYWGMDFTTWGTDGSPSRRLLGGVPATGRWVALSIPLGPSEWGKSDVDMANRSLIGVAWTAYGGTGRVWWGPLSFSFPASSVADPQRSITRAAYNPLNDAIAQVDPNGFATVTDVDASGLVRQVARGVEPVAPPIVFEDQLSSLNSWGFEYGYAPATASASAVQRNGVSSVLQAQWATGSESDLYRDLPLNLAPGTYVKVSVWVMTVANMTVPGGPGAGGASLFIEDGTAARQDGVSSLAERRSAVLQTPTGVWQQLTLPFVVDVSGKLRIHLVQSNFAGTTIWSDVMVQDITPAPAATLQHPNTVYTADFEQPVASGNWVFQHGTSAGGGFVVNPAFAHSGNTTLKLTVIRNNSNAEWVQTISVAPSTTYRVTVWVNSTSSGSTTATANWGGVRLWLNDNGSPGASNWTTVIRTDGQWQQIQADLTTSSNASTLTFQLYDLCFMGDTYWDDVVVQRLDAGGAWSAGWTSRLNGGGASWSLKPAVGVGGVPARDVSVTSSTSTNDIQDLLATAPLRQGATYAVSLWASASVASTAIDVSVQDTSGNRLPLDYPSTCQIAATPNQTLCQNSFTYSGNDATPYQLVIAYGGWGARDVYLSHPVIGLSSQVTGYTSYGQVAAVTDIFGHETRTDYDTNSLYPVQHVQKTASGYSATVLADSPLSYWRLGEANGTTAGDSAGTNPGTISASGVTLFQPSGLFGDNNRAMTFDGNTGTVAVSVPAIDTVSGHQVTVEFWMKWNGGGTWQMPFGFSWYDLNLSPGGNFGFNTANGDVYGLTGIPTSTWLHVAAIFTNGSLSSSQIYLNGIQQGLTQLMGTPVARTVTAAANVSGWSAGSGYAFNGTIDDVAIYNGALTASRIQAHYQAGRAQTTTAAGAPSLVTQVQYNALGQQISATRVSGAQQIADLNQLDSWGRLTARIRNYVATGPNDFQTNVRTGYAYDVNGRLSDLYEPGGAITHTDYDANGNKRDVIKNYVSSTATETAVQHVTTTYAYDALNRIISETSPALTSPQSTITAFVYDNTGRLIKKIDNYGGSAPANVTTRTDFDADGRVIASYDPVGTGTNVGEIKSTRTYDVLGRLVTQISAASAPASMVAAPAQTDFTLDPAGRVTDQVLPGAGIPAIRTRSHVDYDALGRAIATTSNADSLGGLPPIVSRANYDPRGAKTAFSPPTQQQPGSGVPTRTELNLAGQTIRVIKNDLVRTDIAGQEAARSPASDIKITTTTTYDGFGRPTDVTDPRGTVTHTDYDPLDRAVAVLEDPGVSPHLNLRKTFTYSVAGDRVQETWPSTRIDTYQYDPLHRQTAQILNYVSTSPMNADYQTNLQTLWSLDSLGKVLSITDPFGRVTQTTYDLLGRKVAETKNACSVVTSVCQPVSDWQDNVKTQWQVDIGNLIIGQTNPLLVQTNYAYDAQKRLVQVVADAGGSNATTNYTYDPEGHQLTMTDALIYTTTFTINAVGRVTKMQDPVQAANNSGIQKQYSPAGEVISTTIARTVAGAAVTNTVTLDRVGRTLTTNYFKADLRSVASLSFTYDAGGMITGFTQSDAPTTTSITPDALGRIKNYTGFSSGSYTYFPDGPVQSVTDVTGTTTFTVDAIGRIKTASDPLTTSITSYVRDLAGRVTTRADATGITSTYGYSALDDLTVKTMLSGSTQIASWDSTRGPSTPYDAAGNRLSELVTLPGDPMAAPSSSSGGLAVFAYDHLNRLTSATQPSSGATKPVLSYGYSLTNNRTTVSGGTAPQGSTTFAYLTNSALSTETPTGGTAIPYNPDFDGNIQGDAAGRTYHYDSLNRLEWVNDPGTASTITYVYDATGRLIKRSSSAGPVLQLIYRGLEDKVVRELDTNNATIRSYVWDSSTRRLAVQMSSGIYTIATDPHGDIVGLINGSGAVTGTAHYDVWGQVMSVTGNLSGFPFGFQSGYTDPTTGYVLMGQRWYEPRQGRFTSEDPSSPDLRDPFTENPWLYAKDGPASWIDPLGLISMVIADGGGGDASSSDYSSSSPSPAPAPAPKPKPKPRQSRSAAQNFLGWVNHHILQPFKNFEIDVGIGVVEWGKSTVDGVVNLGRLAAKDPFETARFIFYHSPLGATIDPAGFQRQQLKDAHAVFNFVKNPDNLKRVGAAFIKPYLDDIKSGHPGRAVGRILPDIILTFTGVGNFTKVGRGAAIAGDVADTMDAASVAARIQSKTDRAASLFDRDPSMYLTTRQADAAQVWPNLGKAYRGWWVDGIAKRLINEDKGLMDFLSAAKVKITEPGYPGPDFVRAVTGEWWDITTSAAQWARHEFKYDNWGTQIHL